MSAAAPLAPGSVIGILGGGQLGRMLALAAARLGLRTHIYCSSHLEPALEVTPHHTIADWTDGQALAEFAAAVDAVTLEFENVPVEAVEFLAALRPVRPGARALATAQDRLAEKRLARALGAMTAEFAEVTSLDALMRALERIAPPAVLKTMRMGYDGKGQVRIEALDQAQGAWAAMGGRTAILEAWVPFEREVSVIAARGADGAFAAFEPTANEHRNHILHRSVAPAGLPADLRAEAIDTARILAEDLDHVGVLGVEFFVVRRDGIDGLFVNEIAPRVHNSGHWTMDGARTCQFEQHVRAVAGWPLGAPDMTAPRAEMINLIGEDAARWADLAAESGARMHLYGKTQVRDGRKMGHVNRIG